MAEFLGGIGLIAGFLTRIAAFGVLINMVVAVAIFNWQFGFFMNWSGRQKGEGFEYFFSAARNIYYCRKFVNRGKCGKLRRRICQEGKVHFRMFHVILLSEARIR